MKKNNREKKFRVDDHDDREAVVTGLTNSGYFCKVKRVEAFVGVGTDEYYVIVKGKK